MKKVAAAAACFALALTLAGCGGGEAPAQDAQNDAPAQDQQAVEPAPENEVVILESGWNAEGGYIHYGLLLKNEGTQVAEFPTYQITAKDEAGTLISSDEQTIFAIQPGQTVACGFQAGDGTAPASVDFTFVSADFTDNPMGDPITYQIDGTNEVTDDFGGASWVGEITNTSEFDCDSTNVCVILRNGGAIVGGYSTYVDDLKAGGKLSFEVDSYSDVPEHDSFEVYAMAW